MNQSDKPAFRVSILLLAYKSQDTIIEAMQSALAQTVPCEIIVSDDASNDLGYERAVEYVKSYSGPHKIVIRKNETNQGLCQHINIAAAVSGGQIIVFMAGDDISYPQRVEKLLQVYDRDSEAYSVASWVDEIDVQGNITGLKKRGVIEKMDQDYLLHCGKFMTLLGAAMSIRREVLAQFPPLVGMVEDNMLSLRAVLLGHCVCIQESLIKYRLHENNLLNYIFAKNAKAEDAFRKRYLRTIAMYREIADDQEKCITGNDKLPAKKIELAKKIVSMYRIESEGREAVLTKPKLEWLDPIWRGFWHPGLRRKSIERAIKLFIPRAWLYARESRK